MVIAFGFLGLRMLMQERPQFVGPPMRSSMSELVQESPKIVVNEFELNRIFIFKVPWIFWHVVADSLPRVGLHQLMLMKSTHFVGMALTNQIPRTCQSPNVLLDCFDCQLLRRLFLALPIFGLAHALKAAEVL